MLLVGFPGVQGVCPRAEDSPWSRCLQVSWQRKWWLLVVAAAPERWLLSVFAGEIHQCRCFKWSRVLNWSPQMDQANSSWTKPVSCSGFGEVCSPSSDSDQLGELLRFWSVGNCFALVVVSWAFLCPSKSPVYANNHSLLCSRVEGKPVVSGLNFEGFLICKPTRITQGNTFVF